jgi:glycosyltransferase involved in cell wall biosynthesis
VTDTTSLNIFKALAAALRELLADDERRKQMGQAGRLWVRENFHWERVAERVLQAYRQAANT